MKVFKHTLEVDKRQALLDITPRVQEDIRKSGIQEGIVVVYCPHTTAGIMMNENADPDVCRDMIYGYEKVFPTQDREYRHFEGNSHAHMKSAAVGASQTLIVEDGRLILGTWQNIYFCEFDGPRHRSFYVKILEG
ncbi:secondary thiamine-phosphate synthase enzyme YjbQ [Diplocloster agilis]|uniref:Secondary thiamine-phosphate synthase enzyme YjbQ n=1 Tax=Diplocloster agilis TaxID=2850323 RepID=A0A949JZG4_9FIRM|nr:MULTISPECIES: secondary thiamine-phosphate synthase enzyme YjbQ [Lachnospiraceae]MBU9738065.1 secondary thiamine-phosphate synthase enzyme YjbQ [Diplocloster agilis]MBU9746387.1 secondary thiamine-phosphate synthase enzyme YjbQ [Diplocloster agilis]MCU6734007.1 secondary thiamine-phosphate synthase enzyme YjbQ [Suonthocola fibrivorans]SCJ19146.1 Uncharacterized conserved protein [uncultured Clostridium sp.]